MRLGILGGTFNPPHLGHLVCAQEAHLQLRLDQVLLIPTRTPPHKLLRDDPGPDHRLELCRMAVDGDERFAVSDLEIRRDGPSYTIDTLEELHATVQDCDLYLILGGDIATGLPQWREPERLLSLSTLAVVDREGTPRAAIEAVLDRLPGGERVQFFAMPQVAISSTLVRRRLQAAAPVRYLVPDAVLDYIERYRLYAAAPSGIGMTTSA